MVDQTLTSLEKDFIQINETYDCKLAQRSGITVLVITP